MAEALQMWSVSVGASPPAGNDASVLVYGGAEAAIHEEVKLKTSPDQGSFCLLAPI